MKKKRTPPRHRGDSMTIIAIPKILRDKLTDAGADALVKIMDKIEQRTQEAILGISEERFENRLGDVTNTVYKTASDLNAKIKTSYTELDAKIDKRYAELETKIERFRANLIQWMFIFWVGQVGTITAILFAFFKP